MRKVPKSVRKELAELAAKPESEIDFSDLPATTERDWRGAERGRFYRPVKRQLTVRIDADVLEWLKSNGRGYQSRLNSILRAAMLGTLRHPERLSAASSAGRSGIRELPAPRRASPHYSRSGLKY